MRFAVWCSVTLTPMIFQHAIIPPAFFRINPKTFWECIRRKTNWIFYQYELIPSMSHESTVSCVTHSLSWFTVKCAREIPVVPMNFPSNLFKFTLKAPLFLVAWLCDVSLICRVRTCSYHIPGTLAYLHLGQNHQRICQLLVSCPVPELILSWKFWRFPSPWDIFSDRLLSVLHLPVIPNIINVYKNIGYWNNPSMLVVSKYVDRIDKFYGFWISMHRTFVNEQTTIIIIVD